MEFPTEDAFMWWLIDMIPEDTNAEARKVYLNFYAFIIYYLAPYIKEGKAVPVFEEVIKAFVQTLENNNEVISEGLLKYI